jgi:hypothetical protein
MKIVATDVAKGHDGSALPAISCAFETGRVSLIEAETGQRPTVLSLILSGRMHPDAGAVTIDGAHDPALMRDRIALVDAPEVSDPADDLLLRQVAKEELMYADRSTDRATVHQVIDDNGGHGYADARMGDIPGALRTRILAELAAFRREVQGVVLAAPDRHGGDPREWFAVAQDLAARDFAVAVVVGAPSAEILRPLLPPEPEPAATPEPAPHPAEEAQA